MSFRLRLVTILASASALLAGCDKHGAATKPPAPASSTNAASGFNPTNAQPKLPTLKLWLGPQVITSEVALTLPQVMTGMMFRKEMAESEGMLFVFDRPHRAAFYMRNTLIPLTCAYIDREGTILETHDMKPLDETPIEANSEQIQFVLEMKQGWFERNHIATGTVVRTELGGLRDTFVRKR